MKVIIAILTVLAVNNVFAVKLVTLEEVRKECESIPFDSSRSSCLDTISTIKYIEQAPWLVCKMTKRINTDDFVECINIIKNNSYDQSYALGCGNEMLNNDKLECLNKKITSTTPRSSFDSAVSIKHRELLGAFPGTCTYGENDKIYTYDAILFSKSNGESIKTYQIKVPGEHELNSLSREEFRNLVIKVYNGKLSPASSSLQDVAVNKPNSIFKWLYNVYKDDDGISLTTENVSCNPRARCFRLKIRQTIDSRLVVTKGKFYTEYGECKYDKSMRVDTPYDN